MQLIHPGEVPMEESTETMFFMIPKEKLLLFGHVEICIKEESEELTEKDKLSIIIQE